MSAQPSLAPAPPAPNRASQSLRDRAVGGVKQRVRWGLGHGLPSRLMHRAAKKGDLQGQLVVRSESTDSSGLWPVIEQVRASGPIHKSSFAYVTVSLPVVREVLTSNDFHAGVFLPGEGPLGKLALWAEEPERIGPLNPPSLLVVEPPEHTRYRKLVTRVFTVKAVEELRQRTQEIADRLLDDLRPEPRRASRSTSCRRTAPPSPSPSSPRSSGCPRPTASASWTSVRRQPPPSTWGCPSARCARWRQRSTTSARG